MTRVAFRDWLLDADVEANRAAYARARNGGCEDCGCDTCRNFIAARGTLYPLEVRDLFERIGVDPSKEGEAYWGARTEDGKHLYGGWFHFIGGVVSGPPAKIAIAKNVWKPCLLEIAPGFLIGFEREGNAPRLVPLRGTQAVQIEFDASIPWNCDRPEQMNS